MSDVDRKHTAPARQRLAALLQKAGAPVELDGDLLAFGFAGMAARLEVIAGAHENSAHLHLTVTAPALACPVIDCWSGVGEDTEAAVDEGLAQWVSGGYHAYHDALAHDDEPTSEVAIDGARWAVFESPIQARGARDGVLERVLALGPMAALLEGALAGASRAAHRVRWIAGGAREGRELGVVEVVVDDAPRPDLAELLRGLEWPRPMPLIVRQMAVIRPAGGLERAEPVGLAAAAARAVERSMGRLGVGDREAARALLQHAVEVDPDNDKLPEVLAWWAGEAPRRRGSEDLSAIDVPVSRGLLEAYQAMVAGSPEGAVAWLGASLSRTGAQRASLLSHLHALASLYAEKALPLRSDSIVNAAAAALAADAQPDAAEPASMGCSALEAPSAVASVRAVFPGLTVEYPENVADAAGRDPRLPRSASATVIWSYDKPGVWSRVLGKLGTEARPALPPPREEIAARLAELAARPFDPAGWQAQASRLASVIGERDLESVLAAMAHAPGPGTAPPWEARFASQAAAAFVLAASIKRAPIASSRGGALLLGLLDGPVDWAVSAALIALTHAARRVPEIAEELTDVVVPRLGAVDVPLYHQCFTVPARWLLLRLPKLPARTEEALLERIAEEVAPDGG